MAGGWWPLAVCNGAGGSGDGGGGGGGDGIGGCDSGMFVQPLNPKP